MAMPRNPSVSSGMATLRRSPRLVLAVWIVPALLTAPFILAVQSALAPILGRLPADPAPGDLALILSWGLGRYGAALAVPALLAVAGIWLWTVLWHAGLVGWRTWAEGRPQLLGELLGLGFMRWWRYLRLSLVALAAVAATAGAVAAAVRALARPAAESLQEARAVSFPLGGVVVAKLLLLFLAAATLRGLWELGRPGRRSAAAAWLRGLAGALRHPLASLGVLLAWAIPIGILWALPLAAVVWLGDPGKGPLGVAILQFGALLRAAAWVGLVGSFAPVAGLGPLRPLARPSREGTSAPAQA